MGERSEKLERLIADAKARHGDAVRDISRGFGPFEARLAKEPKVIHEQIHRHHKLQLKGNNLWGESSFDSVYGGQHEGKDTSSQLETMSMRPLPYDPSETRRLKLENQSIIKQQMGARRQADEANVFHRSPAVSTSISLDPPKVARRDGVKPFYGDFSTSCDFADQKKLELREAKKIWDQEEERWVKGNDDPGIHPEAWH